MDHAQKEIQWIKHASLAVIVLAISVFALGAFLG